MYSNRLRLSSLIEKGYLPEEIIPPINTKSLAKALPHLVSNLNEYLKNKRSSRCCVYSIPRVKEFRRILGIPNPLHQIELSRTIQNNWSQIESHLSHSRLSLSTLKIHEKSKRSIATVFPYGSDLRSERILRSTGARYLLKADISRFYHSIYTHSIPWALHTKQKAKVNRKDSLFGNKIDKDVRNSQDGQTVGIPIGPDTSRVISEIIGASVDTALWREFGDISGVRLVDDFYLYFKSLSDLERGYSALQNILQEFELALNPAKVEKIELPAETFDSRWVLEIRSFIFRDDKKRRQFNDLISYFDLAFQHSVTFPDEAVLKYSMAKVSQQAISSENWLLYQSLILKTIMAEPKVLPIALEIFLNYQANGYTLDRGKIKNTLSTFLAYHSKLNHNFEVTWGLWFFKSFQFTLDAAIIDLVSKVNNAVVALIALDLEESSLTKKRFDKSLWLQHLNLNGLYSEHWLLAYEAIIKRWLIPPSKNAGFINLDPFFSELKTRDVSFYSSTRQIDVHNIFKDKVDVEIEDLIQRH